MDRGRVFNRWQTHQNGVVTYLYGTFYGSVMVELRTIIPDEIDRYLESMVESGPFNNKAELVRAALASYASSMVTPKDHAFDKENIFSPDGRIYQLEYARESAMRGFPAIGVVYPKGVILVSRLATSTIHEWLPKMHRINSQLVMCHSGLAADGIVTARKIREAEPKAVDELIDRIVTWFWENTSQRGRRPLGISLLVATTMDGSPRLFGFEPSGGCLSGWAIAYGRGSQRMQAMLGSEPQPRSARAAEALAQTVLGKPQKWEHDEVMRLDIDRGAE